MTRPPLHLAVVVALLVPFAGCNNGHDGLTVNGTVTATHAAARSSFTFGSDTRLNYDDATNPPGVTAGHCTITRGAATGTDSLSFGITRPSTATDNGISKLTVQVSDPRTTSGSAAGTVTALFGDGTSYTGTSGAGCDFTVDYNAQDKVASFALPAACTLTGTSATDTATLSGELQYYVCTVM